MKKIPLLLLVALFAFSVLGAEEKNGVSAGSSVIGLDNLRFYDAGDKSQKDAPSMTLRLESGNESSHVACVLFKFKNKEGKEEVAALALSKRGNKLMAGNYELGLFGSDGRLRVKKGVEMEAIRDVLNNGKVAHTLWLKKVNVNGTPGTNIEPQEFQNGENG